MGAPPEQEEPSLQKRDSAIVGGGDHHIFKVLEGRKTPRKGRVLDDDYERDRQARETRDNRHRVEATKVMHKSERSRSRSEKSLRAAKTEEIKIDEVVEDSRGMQQEFVDA
eukprot:CAMPEP_0170466610 /NCGR_PEP_ID=MMETSP0123-20130129/10506_1 /TAXON_ID=182087 /ORGANISM="Favella ehrenbergii, Strain Fehren 1" /LENGTH=110 /DNA_ID=CAMNT_0010732783 /DNA_START=59 /DNA_END=391 /DNA_ORIENTATION=+